MMAAEAKHTHKTKQARKTHKKKVQCKKKRRKKKRFTVDRGVAKIKTFTLTMYCISLRDLYIYLGLKDCLLVFSLLQPVDLIVC